MSDLQNLYLEARENGRRHHAALRHMARQTGLDPETIDRCLKRARRTEAIEARKARTS